MKRYLLPKLPYDFADLEPHIDAATMKVHYTGHHQAYVKKLNELLKNLPHLQRPVEKILVSLEDYPAEIRRKVKNNAGGHANHSLFWTLLTPKKGQEPKAEFKHKLTQAFESQENFQEKFSAVARGHFSNGWAWLCTDKLGELSVFSTKDHESPLTKGLTPLLVLDLWEHAYYLKHQNKKENYIKTFWNVINWDEVGKRWEEFQRKGETHREWRMAA